MDVATAHSDNIFLSTLIVVLLCKVLRNDIDCVNILVFMYFECLMLRASASIFHHKVILVNVKVTTYGEVLQI